MIGQRCYSTNICSHMYRTIPYNPTFERHKYKFALTNSLTSSTKPKWLSFDLDAANILKWDFYLHRLKYICAMNFENKSLYLQNYLHIAYIFIGNLWEYFYKYMYKTNLRYNHLSNCILNLGLENKYYSENSEKTRLT